MSLYTVAVIYVKFLLTVYSFLLLVIILQYKQLRIKKVAVSDGGYIKSTSKTTPLHCNWPWTSCFCAT